MKVSALETLLKEVTVRAVALRRDLHRYPELGLTEFRTASIVADRLMKLGLSVKLGKEVMAPEFRMGVPSEDELDYCYRRAEKEGAPATFLPAFKDGYTGVVGILHGKEPGPVVALRVDMDALPILEDSTQAHLPAREGFISTHEGVMHACGHDVHTAIGLAAAEVLSQLQDRIKGTIKFVFQPGEEGGRGALPMVKAGIVDDVDRLVAIHIGTGVPSRNARTAVNGHLASVKLDVVYSGRSAHAGSRPDEGRNALLAAAQATQALYGISRHHAGRSRINVGILKAGSGRNIIADRAFMQVEVRGEDEQISEYMLHRAEAVLAGAAAAQEVESSITVAGRSTTANSDASLAQMIAGVGEAISGVSFSARPHQAGGSEDATYFMRRVQEHGGKAVYAVIGSDLASGHHTPLFDIDETDMTWGINFLVQTLVRLSEQ